jgi:hypothetical protein
MTPDVWGPPLWYILHTKTFEYSKYPTETDKKNAIEYFKNVDTLLPCVICKQHYNNYLLKRPIEYNVSTRNDLVMWLADLHNEINAQNGKKVLNYWEVFDLYTTRHTERNLYIIMAIIIAIIIVLMKRP